MSLEGRITMSNMGVEIGAKFAIFGADDKTIQFLKNINSDPFTPVKADPDAHYENIYDVDVSGLEPQIAVPYTVDNVKPVSEVAGIKINQAILGSCTNGRYEDLEIAAKILAGKKIQSDVRMLVVPASKKVYLQAMKGGLLETFANAGAILCNPSCGPCYGAHMGLLASQEACIASINRNFQGRMGSDKSRVYLASPAVVAASALTGKITDPRSNL